MKKLRTFCILTIMTAALMLLSGCGRTIDIDTSGMYLVIYDGNGGYLGNKTSMMRKLFCEPGSKIPDYPVEYAENQYTVPSLGLAMREGYELLGWYANADYTPADDGEYIYLSTDEGNGVYVNNAEGSYVRSYIETEGGSYVYVMVEEAPAAEEGEETPAPQWIFIGPESGEEEVSLGLEPGFYLCAGEEALSEIDDEAKREAFRKALETRTFSASEVESVAGYQSFAALKEDWQKLFADMTRYEYSFAPATEADAALDHYSLESGYASLYSLFVETENGAYIKDGSDYLLAEAGSDGQRYAVNDRYILKNAETASMQHYDGAMEYWNFAEDKVDESDCSFDGEKYVLTLYAHWVKKNTVYYHYENGTGQVDAATKKLRSDNISYDPLTPGQTIGRKEIVPQYSGHTFVCWSKTPGENDPWNFAEDVFPENETEMHLYAYYVDGEYTRIVSASGLSAVGQNPSGNYMLTVDIDLGGKEYSDSPLGLKSGTPFTGKFEGGGHTISNFTMKLAANKAQTIDTKTVLNAALFPAAEGTEIKDLNVKDMTIRVSGISGGKTKGGQKTDLKYRAAGLIGEIVGTAPVTIDGCSVDLKLAPAKADTLKSDAYNYLYAVGDFTADAKDNVTVTNSKGTVDVSEMPKEAEITLNVIK